MKELGDTINGNLSESEEIAEVISRIKDQGYDIFLMLEATIGFTKRASEEETVADGEAQPVATKESRRPDFKLNAQDARFLKSLRIEVDEAA